MRVHDHWPAHVGYVTVGARDYRGDGRYETIQVTIALAHIIALEWRWERLDWSKEGKEFTVHVVTRGLSGSDVCSSNSLSYQVIGDDAYALYRAYTGEQAPADAQQGQGGASQDSAADDLRAAGFSPEGWPVAEGEEEDPY